MILATKSSKPPIASATFDYVAAVAIGLKLQHCSTILVLPQPDEMIGLNFKGLKISPFLLALRDLNMRTKRGLNFNPPLVH